MCVLQNLEFQKASGVVKAWKYYDTLLKIGDKQKLTRLTQIYLQKDTWLNIFKIKGKTIKDWRKTLESVT